MKKEETVQAAKCPLCGGGNACGNLAGNPPGSCWCSSAQFPSGIFDLLPPDRVKAACICKDCLDRFTRGEQENRS